MAKRILYISRLLKGYEVRQMVAEFRAQESIRSMTQRILTEAGGNVCQK